jgi:Uma2 family endonuclease
LGGELIPPYRFSKGGPGGWTILVEPEIAFGDNIIVPDLAGWKIERFPAVEDHNWISVAPDWVCEIIAPSTVSIDRIRKMGIYAMHKVPYYWIIDPVSKTLRFLRTKTLNGW